MMKHAYLIVCHNNFEILKKLVAVLDDSRNDIYIHVDRKVRNFSKIKECLAVQNATLTFVKRIHVSWGGYSQIKAELILLEAATKTKHTYYHLISGVDMPIKSQSEIHAFFAENLGKEFISIDEKSEDGELFAARIKHYHFLQDIIGRNHGLNIAVAEKVEQYLLKIQRFLRINRLRYFSCGLYKGGNWFSITHGMAEYILVKKREIHKRYRFGLCADELFLQTTAMASPYAENVTGDIMRYTDWNRGSPYVFRSEDYEALISSEKLFARKFDENIDMEIVNKIYRSISV